MSQLLLEKVARRRIGYAIARWEGPFPYPEDSSFGPLVALTNEHAGSDGDIFSHCFKLMKIGPLVGKRTWGGVIGIYPRHRLVDGTETTQPEFSFWFSDVGWSVENYGTDPDVEVDNAPQDHVAGRDRQLETALAVALKQVEASPPQRPAPQPRPVLAPAEVGLGDYCRIGASALPICWPCCGVIIAPMICWKRLSCTPETMYW